ncbi:MAG: NlpC/P60 family protein [Longimicrobiales bacterium]
MRQYRKIIEQIRQRHVPDIRAGVFDVELAAAPDGIRISGVTTQPEAIDELIAVVTLKNVGVRIDDDVIRLPDPRLGKGHAALVRTAVAPIYEEPRLPAPQISQAVMGVRMEVLSRTGNWLRIRGEDGYLGWVQQGYVIVGDREWATSWERGASGEAVVSLGAELVDADGRTLSRPPWGARLVRRGGAYLLPDGRTGSLANGEVVDVDRLTDRFPARGESVARSARRWHGAPYLWGGVTQSGVDCSGLSQAVLWMHGVALPRDSDLQAHVGQLVEHGADFDGLAAGDLAFFAEDGARINHVAICLGGSHIIHSALSNGGVEVNDMLGETEFEHRLRALFTHARRLLPDVPTSPAV